MADTREPSTAPVPAPPAEPADKQRSIAFNYAEGFAGASTVTAQEVLDAYLAIRDAAPAAEPVAQQPPRFANVSCSQCGRDFGPGDAGYSDCREHGASRYSAQQPLLSRDPDIMHGRLCVTGTRIPVSAIQNYHNAGYSHETIIKEYPDLTREQIDAAIASNDAAQQPEAPPTQDDLPARLDRAMTTLWNDDNSRPESRERRRTIERYEAMADAKERIESDAERIRELEAEVARRKGDPVTRLHNLCEGMEQDRHDSPYSAEAWEAQDAAYREKCAELAASRERERHLEREIKELRGGK